MPPPRPLSPTVSGLLGGVGGRLVAGLLLAVAWGVASASLAAAAPTWLLVHGVSEPGTPAGAQVAAGGDLNIVVWQQNDGESIRVHAASRPAGDEWQPAQAISAAGGNARFPQLSMDAAGDAIAVWQRYNGSNNIVQAAFKPAAGAWQPAQDLSAVGQNAEAPQIAMDGAGDAIAIWQRYNGSDYIIQATTKPKAGSWQSAQDLSPSGSNAEEPAVAIDREGVALAFWHRFDGTQWLAEVSRTGADGRWGGRIELSPVGGNAQEPQGTFDGEGNAVAVWSRYRLGAGMVQAVGYDAAGPQLRDLAIPTAATEEEALSFSVSPLDAWSPLGPVLWAFGDGSTATGTSTSHAYSQPGTYVVTVTALDAVSNSTGSAATVTIFPKPFADRTVWIVHTRALLQLHCPSASACRGGLKLVGRVFYRRHHRLRHRRGVVAESEFELPPSSVTRVAVPLTHAGSQALLYENRPFAKAQLTGSGIRHRAVVLLDARASAARRARLKGRVVQLRARCPAAGRCRGVARLSVLSSSFSSKGVAGNPIGSGRFSLPAGGAGTILVRLSGSGVALLSAGGGPLKVELTGSGVRPRQVVIGR